MGTFWLLKEETVVFSASPDALLAVKGTLELGTLGAGIDGAKKDGLVLCRVRMAVDEKSDETDLVHACVSEEKGGVIVRNGGGGGDEGVIFAAEVSKELVANSARGPGAVVSGGHSEGKCERSIARQKSHHESSIPKLGDSVMTSHVINIDNHVAIRSRVLTPLNLP